MLPILIVDDDAASLQLLHETLAGEFPAVEPTTDPRHARDRLDHAPVAVIVSDYKMPGLTGLELLAHAQSVQPHAARILLTGVVDIQTVITAVNAGLLFRFLVKPWLREELLVAVTAGAGHYEAQHTAATALARERAERQRLEQLHQAAERRVRELSRLCDALRAQLPAPGLPARTDITYDSHGLPVIP